MTAPKKITSLAIAFSKKWENASFEMKESQIFLRDFLEVFGITIIPSEHLEFNARKRNGEHGRIDCLIKGKIAIEMKARGKDLDKAFEQLKEYMLFLPPEDIPQIFMVCDFETIILDFGKKKIAFKTKELRKHLHLFNCLLEKQEDPYQKEQIEANVKAAEKMAKLHDALSAGGYVGNNLEVYLVRLLFCLFAQDTDIFPKHSFLKYIEDSKKDGSDLSLKIAYLFQLLNTPDKARTNLSAELQEFKYINGGLFEKQLLFLDFTEKMRNTLIDCAKFDWSGISPAIFGAMFQGVMDKEYRREIGAHYTSEENILKVINPLFMDSLREELERVKNIPKRLDAFHTKISELKFLDPACGCGNFLIVAYRELRKLELAVLKKKVGKNKLEFNILWGLLRVNVEQFYGIEYEEFPCQIARVGMWLTDHQMNLEASDLFGCYYVRLPLVQSATIVHGNALRIDWEGVVKKRELSYILGNPPFVGARIMSHEQKDDVLRIFGDKFKNVGNLDYVTAWYKKAVNYMRNTNIRCAFVSTNSITQGEQVAILWKPLFEEYSVKINFAYRTFVWSNEAKGKAAVYCVIIGFSTSDCLTEEISLFDDGDDNNTGVSEPRKVNYGRYHFVYENDGTIIKARNINPYLVDAPNIFIESRSKPLCDVPIMSLGNQPIDGGHYLFSSEEKDAFLKIEPKAKKWFRPWVGSHEFINRYYRYFLLLKDCSPAELRAMPEASKRVELVKQFRLESNRQVTRDLAETPREFAFSNISNGNFIVVPEVSSERRKYIPMGFLTPDILCSNLVKIIPNATLYHFGVLTSNVHMAWVRAVCGRLKSDYRYSNTVVYNNFPWPNVTEEQKITIENLAQVVLDARTKFPDSSLADLYDPLTMPTVLLKAHQALDKAVMKLYKFGKDMTESEIVAELMGRYRELVGEKN
ncbi:MAG: N-6 DNA methylase [Chitinispirillales bacterium]|jgi:type I restriction-modification system DNA methylase subunit|nr:N-6 DNA methylase [Chitinispirillales bacterium]